MSETRFIRQQAFDVFSSKSVSHIVGSWSHTDPNGGKERKIDTVFYHEHPKITPAEVRTSLIEHDGYPADIIVRKASKVK